LNTAHQLKHKLRKEVLEARIALPPHVVAEKSARIIQRFLELDEYRYASTIMTYLDFRNEVQTGELVKRAMSDGKRVAVPLADPSSCMLTASSLNFYPDDLEPGAWGILEPKPNCVRPLDPRELDLIVVPGVAFDMRGNRLGYGGGFYDRFLLRTSPQALFIALAYEMQLCDRVPSSSQDVRMHCLITEERVIRIN